MDHKDLKYAISAAFGTDSEEAKSYDRLIEQMADERAERAVAQEPIAGTHPPKPSLPENREIARATLAYFLTRMGFILGVWFLAAVVVVVLVAAAWLLIDPPGWETVRITDHYGTFKR